MTVKMSEFVVAFTVCAVAVFAAADSAVAQKTSDTSQPRTLTTADNWPIHINYFKSNGGKESPVIILFPGVEGKEESMTRKVWTGTATALHKKGFAVVTADLRKHGDSLLDGDEKQVGRLNKLGSADYMLMAVQDLEAIKKFLVQEHQQQNLNIRRLGIATAGSGCLVAAKFAEFDWSKKPWPDNAIYANGTPKGQDVRALFFLSPKSNVRGLNATATIRAVAAMPIAAHLWFNPGVKSEKTSATKLFKYLDLKKPELEDVRKLNEGPEDKEGHFSGEGLLRGKAARVMEKHITDFFEKNLKQLESPWKTRTSRLFE